MSLQDIAIWLQERTAFSILRTEILQDFAQITEERVILPKERLVL